METTFSKTFLKYSSLLIICLAMCSGLSAQSSVIIRGEIRDSATGQALSNTSVFFKGSSGVVTDSTGHYTLIAAKRFVKDTHLQFEHIGYKLFVININFDSTDQIYNIALLPEANILSDVIVTQHKEKYRNKDNPSVELIKQVVEHKEANKMTDYATATYREYEKMVVSVSNFSQKLKNKKFLSKYQFLLNNVDTTTVKGKSLLPLYLNEITSKNFYQKTPSATKKIITGENKVDFGEYIDTKGITKYLENLYAEINIYDNNIILLSNQFLSPIANTAPAFYKFYIRDTIEEDGIKIVHLAFSPRNPQDMLFRGTLDITLDGHYAVQKVKMFSPNGINLNFLRTMSISLDFVKRTDGRYLLSKSDLVADFGLSKKGMGVYGERVISLNDYQTDVNILPAVFEGEKIQVNDSADTRDESFWAANRLDSLTAAESKTYENIDHLKKMRSFKNAMDWSTLLLAGYKQLGPVEIGPASTFYSFNPVEGFRLRLGGRTTTAFSDRYYFEGYGAYGFGDQKWKYSGSATYSINKKSIYQFPQHYVRFSYQHDTKIPGQDLQFVQEDNFFLSFKRGDNDKWLYNDQFTINYKKEFDNHFSYDANVRYWKQSPAGSLAFAYQSPDGTALSQYITTGEIGVTLRYAPHEVIYQSKAYRIPLVNKYPVYQFRYTAGIKGLFGGEYSYQNFEANIFKRFYLSQFGYTDITFDAGYIAGKVPFPLLSLPPANQSFAYQLSSYNMMNFLEFVNDHHVSIMADHYFNGFIFNKIPLLRRLKWRSVIEGKVLYSGLRDENNPYKNDDQMLFPTTHDAVSTYVPGDAPYAEGGFGITNIFKFLRIDYVRRFTYLNHPEIPKSAIRFQVKFDF